MDVPVPASVLSELVELRSELQGELEGLVEKRTGLEAELQAVGKEIEAKQRALELVEATEKQLADQGRGQQGLDGSEPGASAQVRGQAEIAQYISEFVRPT
jgi:hypothetical protein